MSPLLATNLRIDHGAKRVLDIESLTLEPGGVTAVVGPNGAGKSTLLESLAGLRALGAGEVRLDGRALPGLGHAERARRIGFLPQTAEVAWPLDVRTLISLGLIPFGLRGSSAGDVAVGAAMDEMGVGSLAERRIDTLSGGERARVLLARAIVGDPEWLIADEPLAGLDPGHVLEACQTLSRRARRKTRGVILTLHDLTVAWRVANRVIVLTHGRIAADGPPSDALTEKVLREVYDVEARIIRTENGGIVDVLRRAPEFPPIQ